MSGRWCRRRTCSGEPLWRPPAPNGFADDNATWLDGLSQRLDLANQLARRNAGADPMAVFEQTLAPIASEETRRTIARAESRSAGAGAAADVTRIPEAMT